MEYRPVATKPGDSLISPPTTSAASRFRIFDRAFTPSRHRPHFDELPLLDASSFSKAPLAKQDAVSSIVHAEELSYNAGSAFGNSEGYVNLESLEQRSLATSFRAWLSSTYRYIRSSGPANSSRFQGKVYKIRGRQLPTGWRLGTWVCCWAIFLCIVLEFALLIYATKKGTYGRGSGVLLEGSCKEARELELWLLLPLNIAGTVLIGTSNYVMQVVSAPERKEIDQAHALAKSIAVAGVRFKDLRINRGNRLRRSIWWILGLSSLPIHFLLNVAVYSSVQASNTGVLIVSDDFDRDTDWDYCSRLPFDAGSADTIACSLYQHYMNNQTLHFTMSDCLRQYSDGFQTNASSVIVVTNQESQKWYNPPVGLMGVPESAAYGLSCREKYKPCREYSSTNESYYDSQCYDGYTEVSDRNFNLTYDLSTGYTNISLDFYPFCENKTYYTKEGKYDYSEILLTDNSRGNWTYITSDELYLRQNDDLSKITSIRALFSAFQYRYWATAAITKDYLRRDYANLLNNRDPRSWLCPPKDLESNQQCNPIELQGTNDWVITPESMTVKECHVLPKQELCTLRYSSAILIITICFDVVKLSAMLVAITRISKPLATLGDIIESFLQDPDPYTEGCGILDDDQANNWTRKVRTKIQIRGFNYLSNRFGTKFLKLSTCPYCNKPIRLHRIRTGLDLRLMADHRNCGIMPAGSHDTSEFDEQCFAWMCDGGVWWTTALTSLDLGTPKLLERRRWFEVPSKSRWKWSFRFYLTAIVLAIIYFSVNFQSLLMQRLLHPWIVGFDAPDPNSMLMGGLSGTTSIYAAAMLINAPQVAFSMLYFITNATLTMMHTAHEWASFSVHRKALRVSSPHGQQRATYWLQLPWTYSIPLIITSGSMHWLLSRSLYVVKVDVYGYFGERETDKDYFACGYSPIPALLLVVVLASMGIALVGLACRWLPAGMPLVRLNSLAIASACHANLTAEKDLELEPLMWGVLEGYSGIDNPPCSFSARQVTPLQNEKLLTSSVEGLGKP